MSADFFNDTLNALQRAQPFRVFAIELNGGRQLEVDSPFCIVVGNGDAVFRQPGAYPLYMDHESVNVIHAAPRALVKEADAPDAG